MPRCAWSWIRFVSLWVFGHAFSFSHLRLCLQLRHQFDAQTAAMQELEENRDDLMRQRDALETTVGEQRVELASVRERFEKQKATLEETLRAQYALELELEELRTRESDLQQQHAAMMQRVKEQQEQYTQQLEQQRGEVDRLRLECQRLESELNTEKHRAELLEREKVSFIFFSVFSLSFSMNFICLMHFYLTTHSALCLLNFRLSHPIMTRCNKSAARCCESASLSAKCPSR